MARGLLIIDIQRDYFPGGAMPLVEPEAAADAARRVLDRFRSDRLPIVHVKHIWEGPDAPFMRPGTDGVEIHESVAPADGEPVIEKAAPNSFVGTSLEEDLRAAPDLEFEGAAIPGASVHGAFMAALGQGYAKIVPSSELTG